MPKVPNSPDPLLWYINSSPDIETYLYGSLAKLVH